MDGVGPRSGIGVDGVGPRSGIGVDGVGPRSGIGRVSSSQCIMSNGHMGTSPPPNRMTNRQKPVKTLPSRNCVGGR